MVVQLAHSSAPVGEEIDDAELVAGILHVLPEVVLRQLPQAAGLIEGV